MSGSDWVTSADPDVLLSEVWADLTERSSRLIAVGWLRTVEHLIFNPLALRFLAALDGFSAGTVSRAELERWQPPDEPWSSGLRTLDQRVAALVWACTFPRPGERTEATGSLSYLQWLNRDIALTFASATAGPATGDTRPGSRWHVTYQDAWHAARATHADVIRCAIPNPNRTVPFDAAWRTSTAVAVAAEARRTRDSGAMPILADALQDAGCCDEDLLTHLRGQARHHACCWGVRVVLGD